MLSERGTKDLLQKYYGIDIKAVEQVAGGAIHGIQKLVTSEQSLALKWYDARMTNEHRVRRSLRGNEHARLHNIPVAAVIPTLAGHSSLKQDAGWYVVFQFIDGQSLSEGQFDPVSAADFGRVLGELQRVMVHLDVDDLLGDYNWQMDVQWGRQRLLERLKQAKDEEYPSSHVIVPALERHLHLFDENTDQMAAVAGLPGQWVHGDCNPGNFVFDFDGRVAAVLDFDNLSYLVRGFDFMYGMDQSFRSDPVLIHFALKAYAEAASVDADEIKKYPQMWLFCSMLNMWPFDDCHVPESQIKKGWDEYHQHVVWWTKHVKDIERIFMAAFKPTQSKPAHSTKNIDRQ